MSKELMPNEKQLVARLQKAESRVEKSLKTFVDDCIFLGEELIETKKLAGHGNWESFLNRNSSFRFSTTRQASKFIRIAENKTFAKTFLIGEMSIDGLNTGIATATPEQLERVKQIEADRLAAEEQAKADKEAKLAELEAKKAEEKIIAQVQTKEPEIIEGDFTEVEATSKQVEKPEEAKTGFVQIEAEKMEEIEDSLHELASLNKSISKDNDSMVKIFDANDQLGAAVKEIKRLNDINTSLEGRLNGFMNERNALIKEAKYWRAKFEKLEKANVK